MSETIIRAKKFHQLWFLKANSNSGHLEQVDVLAWVIPDAGPPIPVTAFGRFDVSKGYIIRTYSNWIAFPNGEVFYHDYEVRAHLESGHAVL